MDITKDNKVKALAAWVKGRGLGEKEKEECEWQQCLSRKRWEQDKMKKEPS